MICSRPRSRPRTPGSGDKTAEELELEDLLNEVMALKGEAGETTTETPTPTPTETTTETPTAAPVAPVEPERTMESVYAEAYHATLAARKAARRKEAEAWAGKEVAVVASSVKEVYHWLGGAAPRRQRDHLQPPQSQRLGRRRPAVHAPWVQRVAGRPRQVGMRPLSHDHPSRAEYWLNDQGGDWWIAEPVFVPPEANTLDFVFSDGEGEYDNSGGKDYHSPVSGEDGSPPRKSTTSASARRRSSGRAATWTWRSPSAPGAPPSASSSPGRASTRRSRRTRPPPRWWSCPTAPSREGRSRFSTGTPRTTPPTRRRPCAAPPISSSRAAGTAGPTRTASGLCAWSPRRGRRGERAQSALVAKLHVPQDAHVCDFVFTDDARTMEGGTTRGTVWITTRASPAPPAAPSLRCAWCTSRWRWRPSPRLAAWATWSPLSLER